MKKFTTALMAITLFTSILLSPKKADAGIIVGPTAGLFAGVAAMAVFVGGLPLLTDRSERGRTSLYMTGGMVAALIVASIVLDENSQEAVKYSAISNEEASLLGLSESEQSNFNKRVNAINQIGKAIAKKCTAQFAGQTAHEINPSEVESCANNGWSSFKTSNPKVLTDEVYGVVQSLRSQSL